MGSGVSHAVQGMNHEELKHLEAAYSEAKKSGLEGWDIIHVIPPTLSLLWYEWTTCSTLKCKRTCSVLLNLFNRLHILSHSTWLLYHAYEHFAAHG